MQVFDNLPASPPIARPELAVIETHLSIALEPILRG
jgi:hypothetical protein